MIEATLIIAVAFALAWPLGHYMARVFKGGRVAGDAVFAPVERLVYRACRIDAQRGMTWRGYALAFGWSNVALGLAAWAVFCFQDHLPLNPDNAPGMSWDLGLHTAVSFLTNTNQQHYSGQAQLSYLAQMTGIVAMQVLTPVFALCILVAMLRALFGGRNAATAAEGEPRDVGNWWVDLTRATLRIVLPLALVWSLLLASQGVPSTFAAGATATPIDASAGMAEQRIPVGPVAPMVAIKQLGSNGGGWYGPNSAVPLENPTPLSNFFEAVAILLIPVACVFMLAPFTGRRRLTALVMGTMLVFSLVLVAGSLWSEQQPNAALAGLAMDGPNFEGKEVRLGVDASATWAALTTQVNNGSVNAMHDSLNPAGGLVTLTAMLINAIWGGVGCGVVQFLVFVMLAVFLAGLMIGRTPELFGRKLETGEIRLLGLLLVLHPLTVLTLTAITLALPQFTANSNPGFHGISQVFYEYVSAFANNGSGLEGLGDGTPWWNLTCVVALLLGRFPVLVVALAIAARLAAKRVAPEGAGSLRVESFAFGGMLVAVIVLYAVLSFLPALVLGPIGEWVTLANPGA